MRPHAVVAVGALACVLAVGASPAAALKWAVHGCEPPDVFYSAAHDPRVAAPCCPRPPERCPGGAACLGATCAAPYDDVPCTPGPGTDRPNVILFVADDLAYCDVGFMGPGCRTSSTGIALPSPATPNVDALAAEGRYFTLAHTAAPVCAPSREALLSGRYPKDSADPNVPRRFLPELLHAPDGPRYCTFAGGKVGFSGGDVGFDARQTGRGLGRNRCVAAPCAPACDEPPLCGIDHPRGPPRTLRDLLEFIDGTLIGPRTDGALDPQVTYTRAQPFFLWHGSWLPHKPHNPPRVVEDKRHLPLPQDFLFAPSFAQPGTPRFPFGDPGYQAVFRSRETNLKGLYGVVWWMDDGIRQLRKHLEGIRVWDASGTHAVSLWEETVVIFVSDNGYDLPHSKFNFSENGYRTPFLIWDGSRPAPAAPPRIEHELAHALDVLPTVLDYAGHQVPADVSGHSLKPYADGTPPATPLRDAMCGHDHTASRAAEGRYVVVRPGTVGRCAPTTGTACATDADCVPDVCLLGTCGTGVQCLDDDDCPPGENCGLRDQKWCRYGRNPTETQVPTPDLSPAVPCTSDADCLPGCGSAEPLNCTCQYRSLKLYALADGRRKLMDLFVDPDEGGLLPHERTFHTAGDLPIETGDPEEHLARRLGCCLDRWWLPAGVVPAEPAGPACGECEPRWRCDRCGDGIVDAAEECDGANLGGATCASLGRSGAGLACAGDCRFDLAGCGP
jgi:hypothetical protein